MNLKVGTSRVLNQFGAAWLVDIGFWYIVLWYCIDYIVRLYYYIGRLILQISFMLLHSGVVGVFICKFVKYRGEINLKRMYFYINLYI